jgi:hypothetical protein
MEEYTIDKMHQFLFQQEMMATMRVQGSSVAF